jgi:transposase
MQTSVYKFYAEPKTSEDERIIREQIILGARYRKALLGIENEARAAERALENEDPLVRSRRMRVARWFGYRDADLDSVRQSVVNKALDRYRKELSSALKIRWASPEFVEARREIQQRQRAAAKAARAVCGVSSGTYQHLEDSHDLACRTVQSRLEEVCTFIAFDEGAIAVHVHQRGESTDESPSGTPMAVADLLGGNDSFVRIGAEKYARSAVNRAGRERPKKFNELKIRIGSTEKRQPIWCCFNIIMHRSLPADGLVTWVRVHREKCGLRYRYSCQIVLRFEAVTPPPSAETVGVDLGIGRRMLDGSSRIAFAVGSDGAEFDLRIPSHVTDRRGRTESLRSIRDQRLDDLRASLVSWRQSLPEGCWLREQTTHMHQWRAPRRFARLLGEWRYLRIPGDDLMYSELAAWAKKDRHLLAYESHNDRRMRNQIRGRVIEWCATLAKRYGAIGVEKMIAASIREGEDRTAKLVRKRSAVLAPFEVIAQLKVAAKKYGREVADVPPAYTSRTCSHCKKDMGASELTQVQCPYCSTVHDRDRNAATNIMRIASDKVRGGVRSLLESEVSKGSASGKARARRTRKRIQDRSNAVV